MIKVLLFAQLREQLGTGELHTDFSCGTVKDFKEYMGEKYSLNHLDHMMIAVNEEFVDETARIEANDIVAIIPPVSGG